MRKLAAIFILLLLLYGCTDFGMTTMEDCEEEDRDSGKITCYHQAAVTMAIQTQSSSGAARICHDIVDDIGSRHEDDDLGRRANAERNACLYDVVKASARYDEDAGAHCSRIEQTEFGSSFSGAAVTREMCNDQFAKLRQLDPDTLGEEDSLCNMAYAIVLGVLMVSVFYRKK